jgi:hypothetical protein
MAEYIKSLSWNTALTEQYYRDGAIMKEEEQLTALISALDILTPWKFNFQLRDKNLDDPDYWVKLTKAKYEDFSSFSINSFSAIVNSTTIMAPDNLVIPLGRSISFSNLESINSLVETAESREQELAEAREKIYFLQRQCDTYKSQLEEEVKEKTTLKEKYTKLDKEFGQLIQRINDMGIVCTYNFTCSLLQGTECI